VIVDSSALMAIVLDEPDADALLRALSQAQVRKISVATWVEVHLVVESLGQHPAVASRFEDLMLRLKLDIVAVDVNMAWIARKANLTYGKGHHPARLNFGDCFSYALAKRDNEPLLFKGNDFSQTDIVPALPP